MKNYLYLFILSLLFFSKCTCNQPHRDISENVKTEKTLGLTKNNSYAESNLNLESTTSFKSTKVQFGDSLKEYNLNTLDDYLMFEGDIIIGKKGFLSDAIKIGQANKWAGGIIPYEIEKDHPLESLIHEAAFKISNLTNLSIQKRRNEEDYVLVQNRTGCGSFVGKLGGQQIIQIGDCSIGTIQHEFLHTAGMYHEQSRKDRDQYIEIIKENINPLYLHNFEMKFDSYSVCPYDFGSIMHYDPYAFTKNKKATIVTKMAIPSDIVMGQRKALSDCDIQAINNAYK